MYQFLFSDKNKPPKEKSEGLSATDIIQMSQEITGDWLKKEVEGKIRSKGEKPEEAEREKVKK